MLISQSRVSSGVARNIFRGEQMVSVWGREPPVGSRGEAPVGGLGAKPPRSWRLYYKMNVQFLALAYTHIHLAAYSCKVLFTLTALKSPNCSVSRVTAASVAAAGLTTSRCYAHRARHLTVCAEANGGQYLLWLLLQREFTVRLVGLSYVPHSPPTKNISPVLHELHSGPWESGGSSCSICSILATPLA